MEGLHAQIKRGNDMRSGSPAQERLRPSMRRSSAGWPERARALVGPAEGRPASDVMSTGTTRWN
jgi:hypothetical protein